MTQAKRDIVERLREAIRDPECPVQFSPVLMAARSEIERLRTALREMQQRDDKNGSLPPAYRTIINLALGEQGR